MFTEITGNADLYAEISCKCYVNCRQTCLIFCDIEELPRAEVHNEDLTSTGEILAIPLP
jgi:hypothetical protein